MFRTLSATRFNEIANDPIVRPFLGGKGSLDLTPAIENVCNFTFLNDNETAAFIFYNKSQIINSQINSQGIYEVHIASLPEARGKDLLKFTKRVFEYMFLQTDCLEIQAFVPDSRRTTYLWAMLTGMRENFKRENCFNLNGEIVGGSYLSLIYSDWILKSKLELDAKLEFLIHEKDAVHKAWLATTLCSQSLPKAISEYNKWAMRTSFDLLKIVSVTPFVIEIKSTVLQLNADNSLSVLKADNACLPLSSPLASLLLAE